MSLVSASQQAVVNNINNYSFTENSLRSKTGSVSTSGVFEDFFNAAVSVLDTTSDYEQKAQQLQLDYISGKTDDMLSVVLAEQRAYTALNFTVQVTSKIVDSYKQIISMQL